MDIGHSGPRCPVGTGTRTPLRRRADGPRTRAEEPASRLCQSAESLDVDRVETPRGTDEPNRSTRPHDRDLPQEVLDAELEEIRRRRTRLGLDTGGLERSSTGDRALVGLALSGGGVRSATFGLGVVQALADDDRFEEVDYLSTVSGGGSLSSLLTSPTPKVGLSSSTFPLRRIEDPNEPAETPALTHLRNSSNYLGSGSVLQAARIPTLFLRGLLLNLLIFLPFIMAAVLLAELAYEKGPHLDNLPRLILPMLAVFVVTTLLYPVFSRVTRQRGHWRLRNAYELMLAIPPMLVIVMLVLLPLLQITRWAIEHNWRQFVEDVSHPGAGRGWIWAGAVVLLVGTPRLAPAIADPRSTNWCKRSCRQVRCCSTPRASGTAVRRTAPTTSAPGWRCTTTSAGCARRRTRCSRPCTRSPATSPSSCNA